MWFEFLKTYQPSSMKPKFYQHSQNAKPINNTSAQIDGGGFGEITSGNWHFLKSKFAHHALRDDFRIEYKVVAVFHKTYRFKVLA